MKIIFKFLIALVVILVILFIFKHFNTPKIQQNEILENTTVTENVVEDEEKNTYVDTNPIKLGIYLLNDNETKRELITTFSNKWTYHKDITVFNIIYTNKEEIEATRTAECFEKYLKDYTEDISKYRIGFHVKFETEDGTFDKTIISPKDVDEFYDYLEIYLYDGYHRKKGEWYSHTTEEQFNQDTIFTSIKLTAGKNVEKITSNIKLTAFSYDDEDDFDENGDYIGNSKYSITITKE